MKKRHYFSGMRTLLRGVQGCLEVLILTVVYYLIWRRGYNHVEYPAFLGYGNYVLAGIYIVLIIALFLGMDGFKFGHLKLMDVVLSQWIALVITNFVTYWQLCLITNTVGSPASMLLVTGIDFAVTFVCVYLFTWIYHQVFVPRNMVMVFGRDNAVTLKFKMETRQDKYRINKLLPVEAGLDRICREIVNYDAVVLNDVPAQIRNDILKFCYREGIRTYVTPKITDIILRGSKEISLFDSPLLLVRGIGLTPVQRLCKRLMDLVLCTLAMVPALPVMLVVALAIRLEDGGPVFFRQERVSLGGKKFQIPKFRSMVVHAEQEGQSVPATERDPRITRVGRVIRAGRLDELPQLLNILKGDMSVVGPRPERVEHMEKYGKEIAEFAFRTKVKGGLTGYAQIYGKYNTSAYDKLRLDLMYIEKYSLLLDVKLILMTLRILLKKDSTEGFDVLQENERLKEEALRQLEEENREQPVG